MLRKVINTNTEICQERRLESPLWMIKSRPQRTDFWSSLWRLRNSPGNRVRWEREDCLCKGNETGKGVETKGPGYGWLSTVRISASSGQCKAEPLSKDWEGPCRHARTKSQFECPLKQTTGSPSERVIRTAPHTGLWGGWPAARDTGKSRAWLHESVMPALQRQVTMARAHRTALQATSGSFKLCERFCLKP